MNNQTQFQHRFGRTITSLETGLTIYIDEEETEKNKELTVQFRVCHGEEDKTTELWNWQCVCRSSSDAITDLADQVIDLENLQKSILSENSQLFGNDHTANLSKTEKGNSFDLLIISSSGDSYMLRVFVYLDIGASRMVTMNGTWRQEYDFG